MVKKNPVVLAVGEVFESVQAAKYIPPGSRVTFSGISDIKVEFLESVGPDMVLSSLVSRDFDFLDLAQVLQSANYTGFFRVIAPKLPNPKIVISEALAMCPDLKIEFLTDTSGPNRSVN